MAKRLDHILVIDIESTCWQGGFPPRGEANDIIEIGLVSAGSGERPEAGEAEHTGSTRAVDASVPSAPS